MQINSPNLWLDLIPKPDALSHKYSRGMLAVLGGYPVTGAARLAALAGARAGAGLTELLVPEEAFTLYAASMLSIMVKSYRDKEGFDALIGDQRINAILIGPGAGVNAFTEYALERGLATLKPVVVDADALTVIGSDVHAWRKKLHPNCVLTPHEAEYKRLFGQYTDKHSSLKEAANTLNCIILLKGHETLIASPSSEILCNTHASPYLASGGTGDVLAGMIAGFLAQKVPARDAAAMACWIHGECAKRIGAGLLAEDIPLKLPEVLQNLLGSSSI